LRGQGAIAKLNGVEAGLSAWLRKARVQLPLSQGKAVLSTPALPDFSKGGKNEKNDESIRQSDADCDEGDAPTCAKDGDMRAGKKIFRRLIARQVDYDRMVDSVPAYGQEAFRKAYHRPASLKK